METTRDNYRSRLHIEFSKRSENNPKYSLRAFAKAIGIAPSALSEVLNGRRVLSFNMAKRITSALELSPLEAKDFYASIAEELGGGASKPKSGATAREVTMDTFRVMSDWYHAAILELTFLDDFQSDPKWIATNLAISPAEAKLAVHRLIELDLLDQSGLKLKKSNITLVTADQHSTSAAHRKHQRQCLEKALYSLENDDISTRNNTTMTMAINPDKLAEAKTLIRRFNRDIASLLEFGNRKAVYNFTTALYPVSKARLAGGRKP